MRHGFFKIPELLIEFIRAFRLLLWVTPASAPCSPKRNGKALIIREPSILDLMITTPDNSRLSPLRFDLNYWYTSGFGSPVGRAQGIGYVQELVSRLTKTPIQTV